ncbi:DUF4920 domain-containing protein [Lacinutrix gracilariae]|uniref:DUF4920 domain-containing protein n=1 Tax=Lacinutrix gracilariae TaxID=1747198 RepID=A0ABW5K077_9FLAO
MKKIICITALLSVFVACKEEAKKETVVAPEAKEISYASFGKEIKADDALSSASMTAQYEKMEVGDSINTKMKAKVDAVCQAKGCWMKLNLDNGEQVMVKFKDYGFFMPKNIAGQEVIVNGKAYVNEVPVEELRHYAADAGKTEEEIAQITAAEKTYSFEADGVLIVEE